MGTPWMRDDEIKEQRFTQKVVELGRLLPYCEQYANEKTWT